MFKKLIALVLTITSIVGYGYFAFAVITPGQTLDPVLDGLCTDPNDMACFVSTGWELNTIDDYVYNTTDKIGIGTDTPTARLDVVGDINAVTTEIVDTNAGIQNVFDFTTTLDPGLDITETNYRGLSSTLNFTGSFDYDGLTIDPASIAAIAGTTSSTNTGNTDMLIGGLFRSFNSGTGNIEALTGSSIQAFNLSTGEIDELQGIATSAGSVGNGSVNQITGGVFNATNYGSAGVGNIYAMSGFANNTGSGLVGFGYGATTRITNSGSGTIQKAFGVDNKVISTGAGTITEAVGHKYSIYATTGSIADAVGMSFSSGLYGTDGEQPGVEATGNVVGIQFLDNGNGFGALNSTGGGTVTAISINSGALVSNGGSVYGIYIEDGNGENYFGNGLRIGANDSANKLYNTSTGSTSNTLYIGNATIDVTTPSDERTKRNIVDTSFGLDELNAIHVVDFFYDQEIINDGEKSHTGVLAQQVQSIYPEAVTKRSDGYFMVDYKAFIPLLMKSVQDLDMKLSQIEASAETVNNKNNLFTDIAAWFADTKNGITKIFTEEIQTKMLCVADDNGDSTCITKSQLDDLLNNSPIPNPPSPSPDPVVDSVLVPDTEPDPVVEPEIDPVVEPAAEAVSS